MVLNKHMYATQWPKQKVQRDNPQHIHTKLKIE